VNEMNNDDLVRSLKLEGLIKTEAVNRAFLSVDRKYFVTDEMQYEAYVDMPLPTVENQTISAPHMVAIMAEELDARPGMKVLEIGGGSGYHAAIVSRLVAPKGKVVSVEIVESLAIWGKENLKRAGIDNVEMIHGDGSKGYEPEAPYDRIYYTAGAPSVPDMVKDQLKDGGLILGVVGPPYQTQRLVRLRKNGDKWEEKKLTYCVFVPLTGELGYR
jgi:protein-L-isoaspartate(D-aspartate) O-methyltransferase